MTIAKITLLTLVFAACDSTLPSPTGSTDSRVADSSIDTLIADAMPKADGSVDQGVEPVADSFVDKGLLPVADSSVDGPTVAPVDLTADTMLDAPPADVTIDLPPADMTVDQPIPDATVDMTSDAFNPGTQGWVSGSPIPVLGLGTVGDFDTDVVFDPFVIVEGALFRMWYLGKGNGGRQLGYATSADGITWTKHTNNPILSYGTGNAWDDSNINGFSIIKDNGSYVLFYSGGAGDDRAIGRATSTDGIAWSKYSGNPILDPIDPGAWDDAIDGCFVLKDASKYRMWYSGVNPLTDEFAIGYAFSADGITWMTETAPVLTKSISGGWDNWLVRSPSVIADPGGGYTMWYFGAGTGQPASGVGQAFSIDGKNWTKVPSPVFDGGGPGHWDSVIFGRPLVRRVSPSQLRMWYVAGPALSVSGLQIGYATNP
jgi:hypothetical protein